LAAWRVNAARQSGTKVTLSEVAAKEGLSREYLERWVKYLDPANASKASPLFKEFFAKSDNDTLARRAEDLKRQALDAADEYDNVMRAYEVLLTTLGDKKKPPKKPELEKSKDTLLKAIWLDDKANAPFFLAAAEFEKIGLSGEQKQQLAEMRNEL